MRPVTSPSSPTGMPTPSRTGFPSKFPRQWSLDWPVSSSVILPPFDRRRRRATTSSAATSDANVMPNGFSRRLAAMIKINLLVGTCRGVVGKFDPAFALGGWRRTTGTTILLSKMAEAFFIETSGATWSDCRLSRLAGSQGRAIRWSSAHWRFYTASPPILGLWQELAAEAGGSALGSGQEIHTASRRTATDLSRAMAIAACREKAADDPGAIIQVASEVGYDFEAAFNRAFKREFGVPPGQFRRQFKGQSRRFGARSGVGASAVVTPIKKSGVRF